jgi:hypothetical protein
MGLFSKSHSPLPATSYGYDPPANATAKSWMCNNPECSTTGIDMPRSWPYRCPLCGVNVDPVFDEPWGHQAKGLWLAAQLERVEADARAGGWEGGPEFYRAAIAEWQETGSNDRGR